MAIIKSALSLVQAHGTSHTGNGSSWALTFLWHFFKAAS